MDRGPAPSSGRIAPSLVVGHGGPTGQKYPLWPDKREDLSRLLGRGGCGCLVALVLMIAAVGILGLVVQSP